MKKLFSVCSLLIALTVSLTVSAQHSVPRFGTGPSQCNTGACLTYKLQTVTTTSATSIAYEAPNAFETLIQFTTPLRHALTDSMSVKNAWVGDRVTFIFTSDTLTAGRVVTFGNNIKSAGTLTVPASKKATATFIFDGTAWIEKGRALMTN